MLDQLVSGLLAGLSTGIYCLGTCLPIFIPLIIGSKHNLKSSFKVVVEFSLGRLLGYLLFGGLVSFLGQVIMVDLVHQLVALATGLTGLLLIAYSIGFLAKKIKFCQIFFTKVKVPLLLGFLTGINVCPPFLASLTYVFNLPNVLSSLLYFFSFFIGTSLYIIPAGFFGWFSDDNWLQKLARICGIMVGAWFVYRSIIILLG